MLYYLRVFRRIATILFVLAKHKSLFFLRRIHPLISIPIFCVELLFCWKITKKSDGKRLTEALYELGPVFIKVGQAVAVRSDIVGDDISRDLSRLQDRLPAHSFSDIRKIIDKELDGKVEDIFADFQQRPVAAASISQVHFAKLKSGEDVAVKILRPNIERKFKRDIELLYFIARTLNKMSSKVHRLKLEKIIEDFEQTVNFELDLKMEAAAASELKENTKNDKDFKVPDVYWDYTSSRVLTVEKIHGIRIDNIAKLKEEGHDLGEILVKASNIFFYQVYRDGFFHADMHPGNLFVGKNGEIIAVDFGIMGRVDLKNRIFLAEILIGFLNRDYKKVSEVHFEAGYIPDDQDKELFAQAARSIGEPIFGKSQGEISLAKVLAQLFKVSEQFNMETQPQLILLQKTMVLAEGLGRKLDTNVNFWELSKPLVEEWCKKNLGPEAKAKYVACELKQASRRLNKILQSADNLDNIITKDGLKLHPKTLEYFKKHKRSRANLPFILFSSSITLIIILLFILISHK